MAGGASRLRRAANRIRFPCASFSRVIAQRHSHRSRPLNISSSVNLPKKTPNMDGAQGNAEDAADSMATQTKQQQQSPCAICLEPLAGSGEEDGGGQAIFTAQCGHSFHFLCIASNVRYGSVTCPICRAHWSQLPPCHHHHHHLHLHPNPALAHTSDPVLRILDDSIATSRVNRRLSLRSARYDDDDPVDPPHHPPAHPRLLLSLLPIPPPGLSPRRHPLLLHYHHHPAFTGPSSLLPSPPQHHGSSTSSSLCLSARLAPQLPTDVVLVASPNGPHLRLLKQAMALVVFSLRAVDRLAVVTYSSVATRALPLRRMTSHGKRAALQVVDRVVYLGEADPSEGLRKGAKVLQDRAHRNPLSCILHLSDSPTGGPLGGGGGRDLQGAPPFPVHRFHIGFGFGASHGFVMHEFEEFLSRLLGGVVREAQLRVGEEGRLVRLGEMRGGEERVVPLEISPGGGGGFVCVGYSYVEGGVEECLRTGEVVVGLADKGDGGHEAGGREVSSMAGRSSNVERWDYLDPFMARRWAKHLHGYRA